VLEGLLVTHCYTFLVAFVGGLGYSSFVGLVVVFSSNWSLVMSGFVYLVLWVNGDDGLACEVCDSRKSAEAVAKQLRANNRDPWIETKAVRTIEFADML